MNMVVATELLFGKSIQHLLGYRMCPEVVRDKQSYCSPQTNGDSDWTNWILLLNLLVCKSNVHWSDCTMNTVICRILLDEIETSSLFASSSSYFPWKSCIMTKSSSRNFRSYVSLLNHILRLVTPLLALSRCQWYRTFWHPYSRCMVVRMAHVLCLCIHWQIPMWRKSRW